MSEPFIGEIRLVGFNFAPHGWATCEGQLLPIAQNTALFSLIGTTYGGNGTSTFALPDLRGRSPVGQGQGPGLHDVMMGERAGAENITLLTPQMPAHNHLTMATSGNARVSGQLAVPASTAAASESTPANNVMAVSSSSGRAQNLYAPASSEPTTMAPFPAQLNGEVSLPQSETAVAGGSQPVGIRNPYLGMNFIIALVGLFPSRG